MTDRKAHPATLDISIEQAMHDEPRLKEIYEKDAAVTELIDNAMVLEGLARHASTHAAGIVISNKPLGRVRASLPRGQG